MLASSIPPKFPIPWANNAGSLYIRPIPTASQVSIQAGAASLTDGFVPLNMVPVSAGGIPPFGQDMNGILKQVTQWEQWNSAGGTVPYDAAFSAAIGGYPKGAVLLSVTGNCEYVNTVDNNTVNPDVPFSGLPSGTGWRIISNVWSQAAWQATGSANAQILSLTPAPTALTFIQGVRFTVISQGTNTGAVTLNVNGLGAVPIQMPGGIPLAAGALVLGYPFDVIYVGGVFVLLSNVTSFNDTSTGGIRVVGTGVQGANVALIGNGATTPNKYLRSQNGSFSIVNSAYNSQILQLSDSGDFSVTGAITSTSGNVSASAGRVRSALGAYGSGDALAAVTLGDFFFSFTSLNLGYSRFPNGLIDQTAGFACPVNVGFTNTAVLLPVTYPTQIIDAIISFLGTTPPLGVAISVQPLNTSSVLVTTNSPSAGGAVGVVVRSRGY